VTRAALASVAMGLLGIGVDAAHAGRPLNTDDAAILPQGACQLETWLRPSRHLHQFNFQPACNPWGGIEWGASFTRQHAADASPQSLVGLQAKTVFREAETGSWGAGASLGMTRIAADGGAYTNTSTLRAGTLIVSAAPTAALALHANVGATQEGSRRAIANWAAAIEYDVNPRWTLVAEIYGSAHARPAHQLGARTWLAPDHLQLDATIGRESIAGKTESLLTVGLVWFWEGVFTRH
jgi:hypothetical protein